MFDVEKEHTNRSQICQIFFQSHKLERNSFDFAYFSVFFPSEWNRLVFVLRVCIQLFVMCSFEPSTQNAQSFMKVMVKSFVESAVKIVINSNVGECIFFPYFPVPFPTLSSDGMERKKCCHCLSKNKNIRYNIFDKQKVSATLCVFKHINSVRVFFLLLLLFPFLFVSFFKFQFHLDDGGCLLFSR